MKPNLWVEIAGMALVFGAATVAGLTFALTGAAIAGYFALVVMYEVYAARFNQRERLAKRRARRTETGLYGWPMTDVQAQTVMVMPRGAASVEPTAPRIAAGVATPAAEPEPVAEPAKPEPEPEVEHVPEVPVAAWP